MPNTSSRSIKLTTTRVPGINAVPHEDNLRYFDVTIHGPAQSPYEGMLSSTPTRHCTDCTQAVSSRLNSSYQTTIL